MAELHRRRLTTVLTADTALQIGTSLAAVLRSHSYELAYTFLVEYLERIHFQDLLVEVDGGATDDAGYYDIDEMCITQTPGLFVAGDGRSKQLKQLTTAVADGSVAATKACQYVDRLNGREYI